MIFIIFIVVALASGLISWNLRRKFRKYSQMPLSSGLSGAETAAQMLRDNGIYDVEITCVPGQLTDHYNPADKTVNLSEEVFYGRNAAAVAVAAHECGHAVQHATAYSFLQFRTAMVPIQSVSAKVLNIIVLISIFGGAFFLQLHPYWIGLIVVGAYSVITLFSFVTLPVEYDASARALSWIERRGVVNSQEYEMAKDALNTAALTYVVAALGSLVTLLYYAMMFFGRRD
jgi:hypothetical protein